MKTRSKPTATTTTTTTTLQQKEINKCTGNWMTIKNNDNNEEDYIFNEGVDPRCIWEMPVKEKHLDGSVTIKYERCKLKNNLFCVNFKKLFDLLKNSKLNNTFLLNSFQKYKENIKNYKDNNCTLCHFHNTKFFGVKVFFRKISKNPTEPLRFQYKQDREKNETICLKSDKINIIYLGDIITPEEILNGKLIYFDKNMDRKDIYKSKFIINKKNLRKIKCDAGRPLRI